MLRFIVNLIIFLFLLGLGGQDANAFVPVRTIEMTESKSKVIQVVAKKKSFGKKAKKAKKGSKGKSAKNAGKKGKSAKRAKREPAVVGNYAFAKASPELCLARNIIGEGEFEPLDSKQAIAYVTIRYAIKEGRSICDEVYSGRYSWNVRKKWRHRNYVHSIKGDQLKPFLRIANAMIANPVPPYEEIKEADGYVHVNEKLSTVNGWGWVQRNTYSLCVVIGAHEYRIEKPKAEYVTIVVGQDEKGRDKKVIAPIPMPRTLPTPPCSTVVALKQPPVEQPLDRQLLF